ncbi:MAG: amidohydrolase family protein, partial [Armatimonadota bacterium]
YEAIEANGLPILFHTGYLATFATERPERGTWEGVESMLFMRPGTLDTIARAFPDLVMIATHLGQPWCEEGCSVMWKHKNIYCDMSGGTVKLKSLAQLRRLFMRCPAGGHLREDGDEVHTEMVEKLVFGTDNPAPATMLEFYRNFFDKLGVDEETQYKIMTGNAAGIFGIDLGE